MSQKKYIELYQSIKRSILSGEYKPGERLPSKRVGAQMSGYSIITVENAYKMLIDEGYVTSREKSGYFVENNVFCGGENESVNVKPLKLLPEDTQENFRDEFEYSVWGKTVRKVLSDRGRELFVKSPPKGCAVLRNAIANYLLRYRKMYANPEKIIIGSGSEQLYEAAIRTVGRERKYGIENPCYSQIPTVYEGLGVAFRRLNMASDGIDTKELAKADIDVLHVTPFHSYPSGVTASASKRYEYLAWAKKNNGYIIEDDFDSEFFIPGNPIESLFSLDKDEKVIYINTFSESLSPSFRMGYMILPENLLSRYDETMGKYSCTVPVLEQYALAEFISSGLFERHLNRVRRRKLQEQKTGKKM